ncbi:hypothetical protein [Pseudoclavibacter terrae]|uniref:hypothetical protein n=1 Tax=Pseudoclavibacter terrae TaxID=1530195 RepID=UPI00232D979D|nr:hypothetical protein [Pseudoclavibacter terrae]
MTISNDAAQRREAARGNGTTGGQFGNQQHTAPDASQFVALGSEAARLEAAYDADFARVRAIDNLGFLAPLSRKERAARTAIISALRLHYPTAHEVVLGDNVDGEACSSVLQIFDANGDALEDLNEGPVDDADAYDELNWAVSNVTSSGGLARDARVRIDEPAVEHPPVGIPTGAMLEQYHRKAREDAAVRDAQAEEIRQVASALVKDGLPNATRIHLADGVITRVEGPAVGRLWPVDGPARDHAIARFSEANALLGTSPRRARPVHHSR